MDPQIPACCRALLPPREVPWAVQQQPYLGMLKCASVAKDLFFSLARGSAQRFPGGLCRLSSPWGDTWLFFGTGDKRAAGYVRKASEGIVSLCHVGVQAACVGLAAGSAARRVAHALAKPQW